MTNNDYTLRISDIRKNKKADIKFCIQAKRGGGLLEFVVGLPLIFLAAVAYLKGFHFLATPDSKRVIWLGFAMQATKTR
jgi:hypothetical protein